MNISIRMNIVLSLDCKKMVGDEITITMTKLDKHRSLLGSDWTVCYHLKKVARDEI